MNTPTRKVRLMMNIPNLMKALGVLSLSLVLFGPATAQKPSLESLVARLQSSLAAKDLEAYLELFVPTLQVQEKDFFSGLFDQLKMEQVTLRPLLSSAAFQLAKPVFVQAFFENSRSAIQETWRIKVEEGDGRWLIADKAVAGDISTLYKIVMPNDRVERAARVEVKHEDISLTFTDALVFYDNIPEVETALIVIGRGRVQFSPSVPAEKHQLALAYGKSELNTNLDYAYLRFSQSYFTGNVRIEKPAGGEAGPALQSTVNRAYSIFAKNYSRSFTVENPLNGQVYSILPQSQETVFEFRTTDGQDFTYIFSPYAEEEVHLVDRGRDRLASIYSPVEEPGQKKMFLSLGQLFDMQHYDLDVDFTPSTHYFSVKARLEIKAKTDRLDNLKLYLSPEFEILHIYDPDRNELFYTQDRLRSLLYIYLISPVAREETFPLEIYYRGRLEPPPALTDVLTLPQHEYDYSLLPVNYETSFYTHSARWYPSPADEDFFTARTRFIIPPNFNCVANGLTLGWSRLNGIQNVEAIEKVGHSIFTFETKSPVKYLSFVVGRFTKEEEAMGAPPGSLFQTVSVYLRSSGILEMSRDILRFYEGLFGPYPFEKLDIVHRLWTTGGGNSPASFVILNEIPRSRQSRIMIDPGNPVDLSRWKEYFLAHEVAHQWWGQGVTGSTYHDQWLSEGLAQYSSIIYLREKYGDKAYTDILKKLRKWTEKKSVWGAISLGSRLSYLDFQAFQAVIYNKTALVLDMLREVIGPEAFGTGLREFFQAYKYSSARTSHFRKAMERASGRDLGPFFQGWFDSYLLPHARIAQVVTESGGDFLLRLSIDQMGDVFVFPLRLQWLENGRAVRKSIVGDAKEQTIEFRLKAKPQKFQVDPDQIVPGTFDVSR